MADLRQAREDFLAQTAFGERGFRTAVGVSKTCAVASTVSIAPASKNAASAIVAYSSAVSAALAAPARTRYSSEQPSLPQIRKTLLLALTL